MLKIQTYPEYRAMSAAAAEIISMQVLEKPNSILGLATGREIQNLRLLSAIGQQLTVHMCAFENSKIPAAFFISDFYKLRRLFFC